MFIQESNFPAKIILFGEYTILHGSSALTIPLNRYSSSISEEKSSSLDEFLNFLIKQDLKELSSDKLKSLVGNSAFKSNIPIGYGCGSSGALTAAVYDLTKHTEILNLEHLKQILAQMENFFHGNSSGIDPLVSLLNSAVILGKDGPEKIVINPAHLNGLYLYNSGIAREGKPLIKQLKSKLSERVFMDQFEEIAMLNDKIIHNLKNAVPIDDLMFQLSFRQFKAFNFLIPEEIATVWEHALSDGVAFKICGAGGGGFFIFHANKAPAYLDQSKVIPIISQE